jgi:hypothetical protein
MRSELREREPAPEPARRGRRIRVGLKRAFVVGPLALCAWLAFGLSGGDYAKLRSFTDSVERWQSHPEFRHIAYDYAIGGSAAMRTRPLFIPAAKGIMAVRSTPGLPREYAVNPTSHAHYESFSSGPLSAYLYLCDEQNVSGITGLFETLGRKSNWTEADCRTLLDGIKMDFPLVKDEGAVESAEALAANVDPSQTFVIRTTIGPLLRPHIAALAHDLGFPTDIRQMTPEQQRAVLDRLDDHVKRYDLELWRTKQVSDFCGGFWAQVFGPPYNQLLVPFLKVHFACRILLVLALLGLMLRMYLQYRPRQVSEPSPESEDSGGFPETSLSPSGT